MSGVRRGAHHGGPLGRQLGGKERSVLNRLVCEGRDDVARAWKAAGRLRVVCPAFEGVLAWGVMWD